MTKMHVFSLFCDLCVTYVLVMSHLDYGNTLLSDILKKTGTRRDKGLVAKLILNKSKYSSTIQCLHWLPFRVRCDFEILCPL